MSGWRCLSLSLMLCVSRIWDSAMGPEEWKQLAGRVADSMKEYTRPYVTPMRTGNEYGVWLLGTGSYIAAKNRGILVTAEHVIRDKAEVHNQFWGSATVFPVLDPFIFDKPLDVTFAPIRDEIWNAEPHGAMTVPRDTFAVKHAPLRDELLFFRGFAGENAHYGFGIHEANATAYCSQEPHAPPIAPELFEIMWKPNKMEFTFETSDEMRAATKHNDPHGLSGSLVWNTRYVEKYAAGQKWRPEDGVVTGLLHRYAQERETVVALRVEYLRAWLERTL
jgi:hypothetical protein